MQVSIAGKPSLRQDGGHIFCVSLCLVCFCFCSGGMGRSWHIVAMGDAEVAVLHFLGCVWTLFLKLALLVFGTEVPRNTN